MKKIEKIILVCLIIAVVVLYVITLRNSKNANQYDEKMRVSSGNIEYMNDGEWKKLTSVGEVVENNGITTTKDGKEIEICIEDGYLSWNYVGETDKNKLIAITDLIGEKGTDGIDGKDGTNGTNGKNGTNGTNGKDGANGLDGKDGKNGIDGKDGVNGINGEKGDKGDTGEKGDKGDKGEDANPVINKYLYLRGQSVIENEEDKIAYNEMLKPSEVHCSEKNSWTIEDGSYITLDKSKKYLLLISCITSFQVDAENKRVTLALNVYDGTQPVKTIGYIGIDNAEMKEKNVYESSESRVITGYDKLSFLLSGRGISDFYYTATIFELAD